MKTSFDPQKIEEALTRSVDTIYPDRKAFEKKLLSGDKIKLYCGYDPSSPHLHLGHMISLKKLAQFQELGHEVIMLIGDFTGMIGDPTDKKSTRPKLTRAEVLENAKNYQKYASKFLQFSGQNPAKILYNSQWQDGLKFADLIELASNFTVQQMLIRDFFQERIKEKKPIFLHEFLYPLAQAYDSAAMGVDLEIGGRDQTFNMLAGRDLVKILKNKEKFVLSLKLLTDPSGKKMGKTEGNLISLGEDAPNVYGKVMAWPDELIELGFELLTDVPIKEYQGIMEQTKSGKLNPREAKARLAREIVATCHDSSSAVKAEEEFDRIFKDKQLPSQIPAIQISEKSLDVLTLLVKTGLASSKSEAKRLVVQGGVKIDNVVEKDWQKVVEIKKELILQAGKRKFAKIVK